jgi:CRP/FNR family transcriptional regulator, cyclic AMP receptor protein
MSDRSDESMNGSAFVLTPAERRVIRSAHWFSSLSQPLQHEIFRRASVKYFQDGDLMVAHGDRPEAWFVCAKGSIRVISASIPGKQGTLSFVEPGVWFGDVSLMSDECHAQDAYAHGACTVLYVDKLDFKKILAQHVELYEALLRLQATHIRNLFGLIEDINRLSLRARLAKQLLCLLRRYGVRPCSQSSEELIGIRIAQSCLAQLLGASRPRVNLELRAMERENIIRIKGGLAILDRAALLRSIESEDRELCLAD